MKMNHITGVSMAAEALSLGAGCSGGSPAPSTASTTATPVYDTFEKIGDAIGCLSLSNSEPETTDIQANKYCSLEHPSQKSGGVTIYQYADVAHRDKSLKAGLVYQQSYLVLSDTWTISGDIRDLQMNKASLGTGDLRSAEPEPEPSGNDGVGEGDPEDPLEDGAKTVPPGKSATYHGEKVQSGKIYCNSIDGRKNQNQQFDSCRETSIEDNSETKKAGKGREYYLVACRWKNVSKEPVTPSDFGTLVTADGTEYAAKDDLSDTLTNGARGNDDFSTYNEMNPGTTGRILLCYSIPKGTKVKAVHWGIDTYQDNYPAYAFTVR
jgi:hypothetical protein